MEFQNKTKIKIALMSPLFLLHYLLFSISRQKNLIISDIKAWGKYRDYVDTERIVKSLFLLLIFQNEFRTQFILRLGTIGNILFFLNGLGGNVDLAKCKNIGEGFVLMHGIGTVFNAASVIGKNCTVLHNVTIGAGRGGAPTLGDNVYVGAGALIIGGIKIGDNVKIGAGAIVVEDVPSNSTVVCEKARIIRREV